MPETDRRACWEGFLSGRQRARAADRSSERALRKPLGDLGGPGGVRDPREDGCWVSAFVLGSTVRETLQQEGPRVPARVSEEEQVPSPKVPSPNLHSLSWEPSSGEARLLRHAGAEGVRRRREGGRILKKAPLRIHAPGAQRVKSKTPGHYQSLNTRASLPLEDHSPGGRGTNGLVARPPSPHRAPPPLPE